MMRSQAGLLSEPKVKLDTYKKVHIQKLRLSMIFILRSLCASIFMLYFK